jgi:hypothetical protein
METRYITIGKYLSPQDGFECVFEQNKPSLSSNGAQIKLVWLGLQLQMLRIVRNGPTVCPMSQLGGVWLGCGFQISSCRMWAMADLLSRKVVVSSETVWQSV